MAYDMTTIYGMNDKVGQVSFYGMSKDTYQRPYSDNTATLIDDEVRKLLDSQYERAQELLRQYRDKLELLARELLDKEVLLKSDLEKLIGPRPIDADQTEAQEWVGVVDNANSADLSETLPPPLPPKGEDD